MKKTLSVVETVKALKYSRAHVYTLLVEDKLDAKKNANGEWRISAESVRQRAPLARKTRRP